MSDSNYPLDLGLLQEQSTRGKLLPKLNRLGKLYEERDRRDEKPRFGVKQRFIQNEGYSFFRELRNYLQVNKKGRLK